MRLLHTSDWHLGRQFHGVSLLEEQAAAIARIAELAREHAVDAVLIQIGHWWIRLDVAWGSLPTAGG